MRAAQGANHPEYLFLFLPLLSSNREKLYLAGMGGRSPVNDRKRRDAFFAHRQGISIINGCIKVHGATVYDGVVKKSAPLVASRNGAGAGL